MSAKSKIFEISRKLPETADFQAVPLPSADDEAGFFEDLPDTIAEDAGVEFEYDSSEDDWEEHSSVSRSWLAVGLVASSILIVGGWSAYFGWANWAEIQAIPTPSRITNLIGSWAIPMALLAVIWLLAMRSSRAEALRFADVGNALREESRALEGRMQAINGEIALARSFLAENARELDSVGRHSAQRLTEAAQQLGTALADADEKANLLAQVSNAAVSNLEQLRNHLPVVTSAAKDVTNQIGNAGRIAQSQIETLVPALKLMDETAGEANVQLSALADKTATTSQMLENLASRSAASLQQASSAAEKQATEIQEKLSTLSLRISREMAASGDDLTEKIAQHGENLTSLFYTVQSELDQKAEASSALLSGRLGELQRSIAGTGEIAIQYNAQVDSIIAKLDGAMDRSHERIASFDKDATERVAQLAFAINALAESSEKLGLGLEANENQANSVLHGSEKLLLALDAASRELDDSLPAAFVRLEERFSATQSAFSHLLTDSKAIEDRTNSLCQQLSSLETLLTTQKSNFDNLVDGNDGRLNAHREKIEEMASALASTRSMIADISANASESVSGALQSIRTTTAEVASSTKEILESELGSIAETLSEQNHALLRHAVDEQLARINSEMQGAIERNLTLSTTASQQITQQLTQLNELTTNLESRVGEAQAQFSGIDNEGFARRMALLTESLNSAAIDVAKILSNDVTDTAWAAYLKGDRGVFTRRAVKLLDGNESKIVASYYDEDIEFREHVNRYIHDFETMMRVLLSTRDGNAVGITLLSSDVGKLYVALAQAIDRLRD